MDAWPWSVGMLSSASTATEAPASATEQARAPVSIARIGRATAGVSVLLVMAARTMCRENRLHHGDGRDHEGGFRRGNRLGLCDPGEYHRQDHLPAGRLLPA